MKKKAWIAAGLFGLAAAGGVVWWALRNADAGVSYRTAKIERGSLQAAVSASGTVTPVTQVQVSSQVSGQIKELFVDFNSEVTAGQLIARLDPETFEYRLRQSNADLEAARASVLTAQANVLQATAQVGKARVDVQEAQRDLDRKQDLVAKNFISAVEADRALALVRTLAESLKATEAQVAVANAQAQNAQAIVKQRDAQLAQARIDLERTQIRSPVTGIIIKRSVEVGQTVAASLQAPELFVIAANLNDMQVETSIDEADISRVRTAQKVSFTIDAFPGRSFDGAVKQVRKAAVSAQNVTTYTVVVSFANPGASLLPGMTANVRIITEKRDNVLKVPNAALRVRIAGVEPAASGSATGAGPTVRTGSIIDTGRWSWIGSAQAQPAGGGPGALRERLVGELELNGEQQTQLDAILADLRPRFAALRELADGERQAAREKVMGELRERIGKILTPEQRERYAQQQAARAAGAAGSAPVRHAGVARAASSAGPEVPVSVAAAARAAPGEGNRAGGAGGGPLREFRDRLVNELQLTPAQVDKVDALLADARPRFGELRSLSEEERPKARERILADLRARVADQLTPEQKAKYQQVLAEIGSRQSARGRIYLLGADNKPAAYNVRLGISDGVATELIVAPGAAGADALVEGATVITGVVMVAPGAAGRPGTPGPRPPF
jgi:HlyD family secretion protein